MADTLSSSERSQRMALVRGKNTGPELLVRRMVRAMGYRFFLHRKDLPGRPDLVFPRRKKVVFVHGCFWHRHQKRSCKLARLPKSRLDFWLPKLEANRLRDGRKQRALRGDGWKILVVWECELGDKEQLENKIRRFLGRVDARHRVIRRSRRTRAGR
jgi:DNA mismatch endonuclease (patch repair protein)